MITRSRLNLLRPLFRYSPGRSAYVLRIVGNSYGPVYVLEGEERVPKDPSEWQSYPLGHDLPDPEAKQDPPA